MASSVVADLAAVDQPVVDRLEVAERRRLFGEGDEVATIDVAEHRVRAASPSAR